MTRVYNIKGVKKLIFAFLIITPALILTTSVLASDLQEENITQFSQNNNTNINTNENNNTNNINIDIENNQTQNQTVEFTSASIPKVLPATGPSLAAGVLMLAAIPLGLSLRKYGRPKPQNLPKLALPDGQH